MVYAYKKAAFSSDELKFCEDKLGFSANGGCGLVGPFGWANKLYKHIAR